MSTDYEYQRYTPEGFEGEPTSVPDALKRARAVLEAEGRWVKGNWFHNDHPEVDPEDAFCNDWKVCAEGAVLVVTVGAVRRRDFDDEESEAVFEGGGWGAEPVVSPEMPHGVLYRAAVRTLRHAGEIHFGTVHHDAHRYNDFYCKSRTDVLAWFDKAIQLAVARFANPEPPETEDPEPF